MNRQDAAQERPIVRVSLDAAEFPFTVQAHDEATSELLWEHVCEGPGPIEVPSQFPRKVSIKVISPDGSSSTLFSNGTDTSEPAPAPQLNLNCPKCGHPAGLLIGETQATCSNPDDDACDVILFNPSLPDGGLSNPQMVSGLTRDVSE